jgi:hypothetical protein
MENMDQLLILQREARSSLGFRYLKENERNKPVCSVEANDILQTSLISFKKFVRTKRQPKKDVRTWEKEDKRRRYEFEDKKKRRTNDYLKAILIHRDDFLRFHKGRKAGFKFIKVYFTNFY